MFLLHQGAKFSLRNSDFMTQVSSFHKRRKKGCEDRAPLNYACSRSNDLVFDHADFVK